MNLEILKEKGILESLKDFTMGDMKWYANKYIADDLEVGGKYNFNGRSSVHYVIIENIKKGLHELYGKYSIDYADMFKLFGVYTWHLEVSIECDSVGEFKYIGNYNFGKKQRKNASISNSEFEMTELPTFEFESFINDDMSVYDYLIRTLNYKKDMTIQHYKNEIESYKMNIKNCKKMIEDLENLEF
jgi:hypothetical protein